MSIGAYLIVKTKLQEPMLFINAGGIAIPHFASSSRRRPTMTELKPCPFCGVPESKDSVNYDHHKDDCYLKMTLNSLCKTVARYAMEISRDGLVDEGSCTPEQIHRAWNTRTERTCQYEECWRSPDGEEVHYKCSLCGVVYGFGAPTFRVCPHCGAKVVE